MKRTDINFVHLYIVFHQSQSIYYQIMHYAVINEKLLVVVIIRVVRTGSNLPDLFNILLISFLKGSN